MKKLFTSIFIHKFLRRFRYLVNMPVIYLAITRHNNNIPWSKGYAKLTGDIRQIIAASFPTEFLFPVYFLSILYRPNRSVYWISIGSKFQKGTLENFIEHILPNIERPFVLLTSDGDRCLLTDMRKKDLERLLSNKYLVKMFSQNVHNEFHNKLNFLPIGLDLHTNRSNIVGLKKLSFYNSIRAKNFLRNRQLVADCLARATSDLRLKLRDQFRTEIQFTFIIPKNLKEIELWNLYKSSTSVLSLSGNGFDCHRTWEAYFLGCNVFCEKNIISDQLSDFGINIFDNIHEMSSEYIQETIIINREAIWLNYVDHITSEIRKVRK
jgi:hypothetical protein